MDGQGEGVSVSLFHAQGNHIELIETYPVDNSLGMFYAAAGAHSGFGWHPGPGKLMGLAPFGQVRQPIDFHFDPDTGRFRMPATIQKAIDDFPTPPTANDIGQFWLDYFEDYHYPYQQLWTSSSSGWDRVKAYHVTHYVDFAASVQHTLETIGHNLVLRLKKLTGEKNLVLGGGCALNCTMNEALSRQKIFDRIYVFPAANDAGCSIGAALALSHLLDLPTSPLERLSSPAFGRTYRSDEIITAIKAYGFTPEKLSSEALIERVSEDLAADKIVAWFRGQDEFGPRALGRRSFLANPSRRETLGRLNVIKGREMWRPKIPAVVHVDFTTRSHLVDKDQDGIYWSLIDRFYQKTGIPLVCNTSLNVAGQPLVHTPEEVLAIYSSQEDVQTLVIEDFYLTKLETPEAESI